MEGTGQEGKGRSQGGDTELSRAEIPNRTPRLSDAGAEGAGSADEERRVATRAGGGARTRGKRGGRQDSGSQGLRVGLGLPPAEPGPAHVEQRACAGAVLWWCVEKEPVWRQLQERRREMTGGEGPGR